MFGLKSGKIKDRVCEEQPDKISNFTQIVDVALAKETYMVNEGHVNWINNGRQNNENVFGAAKDKKRS